MYCEKMINQLIKMTLREVNNKLESLYRQLDLMRIYESEMLKQEGRKKYQELLDSTLDQINQYQILKDKMLKK